jgi:hypothetical protein
MAIGKSLMVFMCFLIACVAMVAMFSTAQTDKVTAAVYTNATSTINATSQLAQTITSSGTGLMQPLILITAIMFFGAVIMIFRKR